MLQRFALLAAFALLPLASVAHAAPLFEQTDLVSSVPGLAPVTDPNLKNPWGVASSPTGPLWVSNQVTATSTVYNGAGQPFPLGAPLVVTIPTVPGAPSGPTGVVFNPSSDFQTGGIAGPAAVFIFSTLDGTLAAWHPSNGTSAVTPAAAPDGAVYTGLAIGNNGSGNFLYVADSANAKIDVYNGSFVKTSLAGSFTDPNLPAGFTPYNVQNLGGKLLVTYENEASGGGIVNEFDLNGNLLRRVSSNAAGGPLDSPWGLAFAPASFGTFAGALLVGNEGDGHISAFNFATGDFLGQLLDTSGNPIANPGLWGLIPGNGGEGGDPEALYLVAGIEDEQQGLLASLRPAGAAVPEPSAAFVLMLGAVMLVTSGVRWVQRSSR